MKQKYEYKYVEVRTCGLASDDYKKNHRWSCQGRF